jgi:PD-(D/E)XK nuclease superfamily protein
VVADKGQATFDFESVAATVVERDETRLAEATVSVEEQVRRTADDYQLQMQAYALALRELLGVSTPTPRGSERSVRTRSGSDGINPEPSQINSLRAILHFLDPNIEIRLDSSLLDQETCAEAIDQAMSAIASLDATLDADRFSPLPATHCRMCNFVELCPAGREWLKGSSQVATIRV